jgi:ABC-type uncharacterized transport system ATPase component
MAIDVNDARLETNLQRLTGYSRQHLSRLLARYRQTKVLQ